MRRCLSRHAPTLGVMLLTLFGLGSVLAKPPESKPEPVVLMVLDPLAKELACACVKGYGQRDYRKLAARLEKRPSFLRWHYPDQVRGSAGCPALSALCAPLSDRSLFATYLDLHVAQAMHMVSAVANKLRCMCFDDDANTGQGLRTAEE